jgi:hypothetical protein
MPSGAPIVPSFDSFVPCRAFRHAGTVPQMAKSGWAVDSFFQSHAGFLVPASISFDDAGMA